MGSTRVAVVTGSNKGIGFAIVRGLCKQFRGDVYLTSRDEGRGRTAVVELEKEGLHPKFHQLDIDDQGSIDNMKKFLSDNYGGLDLLVNNAGIAFKVSCERSRAICLCSDVQRFDWHTDSTAPFTEQAEVTLRTNYWSTLHVSETLFPLLRSHARVVHVSSIASTMTLDKCSKELRNQLTSVKTFSELNRYMTKFVDDVKASKHEECGWPSSAYGVSKIGVTLMARIHQEAFDQDTTKQDIVVNACCPGYVKTDMSNNSGVKTIDEGADTPLYLALLPEGVLTPKGKFLSDRKVQDY